MPAPTMENSIQGKIPGAVIEQNNGGAPGGGTQIQIRGITSINGNAIPLYVVDGVIVDNETVNAATTRSTSRVAVPRDAARPVASARPATRTTASTASPTSTPTTSSASKS